MTTDNRVPTVSEVELRGFTEFETMLYATLNDTNDAAGVARRLMVQHPERDLAKFIKAEAVAGTDLAELAEAIEATMQGFLFSIEMIQSIQAKDAALTQGVLDVEPEVPVNG